MQSGILSWWCWVTLVVSWEGVVLTPSVSTLEAAWQYNGSEGGSEDLHLEDFLPFMVPVKGNPSVDSILLMM